MCHLHTFGLTGGSRGEQDVGQVVGVGCRGLEAGFVAADTSRFGHRQRRQPGRRLVSAHEGHPDTGAGQHPCGTFVGMIDADRHVHGAGGQDGKQRGHLFGTLGSHDRDGVAGAHAGHSQAGGDLEHLFTKLTVGEVTGSAVHRRRVGL